MTGEVIDGSRGTALWGINRFRSDALSQLLNDLMSRESEGLKDGQCEQVKEALGAAANVATALPDGSFFRRAIWQEMQDFLDIYERWNSHGGSPDNADRRKRELRELRKKRNRIARRIRKNQHILQNDLDLRLVEDMYAAFGNLANSLPEIFVNVSEAVGRFESRK